MSSFDKMSANLDSGNTVELTSFNHLNGESAASSQKHPHNGVEKKIPPNHSSSQTEIIGPTGTVRGFKNMIKERKECLRLSFVEEAFEVGNPTRFKITQLRFQVFNFASC